MGLDWSVLVADGSKRVAKMAVWPYSTQRWQRLRKVKLAEDPLCVSCLEMSITKPANHVDHVKAIKHGGDPWEWSNLQSLCASCHTTKTSHIEVHRQGRVPVKGCDEHGNPLDPGHFWNQSA